jgi:hypothetical protein
MNLADEVEELFIKHFAEEDRRKAMKYLKPQQHKDSHSVTFFIGEFQFPKYSYNLGYQQNQCYSIQTTFLSDII